MMGFDSEVNKGWRKDEVAALIALYESEQCLYDKNDPNHYDAVLKNAAYERIRQIMSRIRPECTSAQIRSRIKFIRSQYTAEKLRRDMSIQSGLCTEESYKPSLWCFGLLQFLDDYLTPKKKKIKTEEIENEVNKDSDADEIYQSAIPSSKSDKQNHKDEAGSSFATDDNSNDEIIVNTGHNKRKRKQNNSLSPKKVMNETEKSTSEISYDREDIFGQYVAGEMRALRDNPLLYLQTKQSILEILTSANFELINPE